MAKRLVIALDTPKHFDYRERCRIEGKSLQAKTEELIDAELQKPPTPKVQRNFGMMTRRTIALTNPLPPEPIIPKLDLELKRTQFADSDAKKESLVENSESQEDGEETRLTEEFGIPF